MKKKQTYKGLFAFFFAVLLLITAASGGRVILPAFAAVMQYTGVMEDLQKDESFDAGAYPDDAADYSIRVIQIAEGAGGEFFVYTYQPSQKTKYLIATCINMALKASDFEDGDLKIYDLELLSSFGVFAKYKVKDFAVLKSDERYYNIVSIFRKWDKGIDDETGNDNMVSEVPFEVGKCYRAKTENGETVYECKETETVKVTSKYCGFYRYKGVSPNFGESERGIDSHYIAFATDTPMDALLEAEVSFASQGWKRFWIDGILTANELSDPVPNQVTVNAEEEREYTYYKHWFWQGKITATWNQIQTVPEFKKSVKLDNIQEEAMNGMNWVLRFSETEYYQILSVMPPMVYLTQVETHLSEETILRLKFQKDGTTYNLGVVDNKQAEGWKPSNGGNGGFAWWWILVGAGAVLVVSLVVWGVSKSKEKRQG